MMSFFTIGLAKEFFIKLNNKRILMRFADGFAPVFAINCSSSCFNNIRIAMMQGCPPPPIHPPGQAMTSMAWNCDLPDLTSSRSFLAFPSP